MTLRATLDRLVADFTQDIFAALGNASLEELAGGKARPSALAHGPGAAASRSKPKVRSEASPAEPSPEASLELGSEPGLPSAPAAPAEHASPATPEATAAARRILITRGAKGATGTQLEAELVSEGFDAGQDVVSALVAEGFARDSGFRRAAGGKATSPVYIAIEVGEPSGEAIERPSSSALPAAPSSTALLSNSK